MTSSQPGPQTFDLPATVLVVEDNPIIAMNTEALLRELGIPRVQTAGAVAPALELVESERFDLAILDLQLADGEDSLPVAALLGAQGVPIIFATGFGENISLPEGHGAARILKKPYSFDDLERIIRSS
jgi:CheY-like chemotaxis protein